MFSFRRALFRRLFDAVHLSQQKSPKTCALLHHNNLHAVTSLSVPQQRDAQRHHDDRAEEQREAHGAKAGEGHAKPEADGAHAAALPIFEAGPAAVWLAARSKHDKHLRPAEF